MSPFPVVGIIQSFTEVGKSYEIRKTPSGKYLCNCQGFQQRKKEIHCRHIEAYINIGIHLPFWVKGAEIDLGKAKKDKDEDYV
jgi:hypothetical protein